MISIKLKAEDVRMLKAAKSAPELRGMVDMVLGKVELAETEQAFKTGVRKATEKSEKQLGGWKLALAVAQDVLGDQVYKPPFPDSLWYQRINRTMRMQGMDADFVRKLAEHARDYMRMPISLEFMISQHARILAGEFDNKRIKATRDGKTHGGSPTWKIEVLPDD